VTQPWLKCFWFADFRDASERKSNFRALLQDMVAPTHAEPGCKLYELYDSDSRGRFFLYERWESQAALDLHMATPHFKRLKQTGEELVREPFEINFVKKILAGAAAT
jgi:quinol monooxygenase YgiN